MTTVELCDILSKKHKVDMACPYTTGIFMNIVVKAVEEYESDDTPWWRTLGSKGEIKGSYPNTPEEQMALLEVEGFFLIKRERCVCIGVVHK